MNRDDNDDELLLFTSLSVDRLSSPLSSLPSPLLSSDAVNRNTHGLSQSPSQDFLALSVSPRSPLQALPPPEEQQLDGPRYVLRHRRPAQLMPYTVDQLKYKEALRSNPDAIVKFKNLALRNHHHHPEDRYEQDEETQRDEYIEEGNNDEDGDWEARERRRHQRHEEANAETNDRQNSAPTRVLPEHQQISYPEILQDLSSTDEEEANEKHILFKEARKIVKERKRQREIQEKEERRRKRELRRQQLLKRKPFPTSKISNGEAPCDDDVAVLEDVCHFYANICIVF